MKKRISIICSLLLVICMCYSHIFSVQAFAVKVNANKKVISKTVKTKKITNTKKTIAPKIISIEDINSEIIKGDKFSLPGKVLAKMSDGNDKEFSVKWSNNNLDTQKSGTYSISGRVNGYNKNVNLTLVVKEISKIDDLSGIIDDYKEFQLPSSVTGELSDGSNKDFEINWDINNPEKPEFGVYVYYGTVNGYDSKIKYTLDRKLPDKVQEIIDKIIKPGMTDYEKELAIHDYLTINTVYDEKGDEHSDNLADYDVIVNGKGTYYAKAFNRLLNAAGIENKIINGEVKVNDQWFSSSWNLVKLDGDYYHVDALWDDPSGSSGDQNLIHDYLNLNDTKISSDHRWDKSLYPPCNATKYWYYAKVDAEINNKVASIIATVIKPGMTDYEKEFAIHNYIIMNTVYDDKAISTYDGEFADYDVIVKGKGVSYNKAFNRLINGLGIECKEIDGEVLIDNQWMGTSWNLVKLDGDYYHVDIAGDLVLTKDGGSYIVYKYLNLSDKDISTNYRWDQTAYPKCVSEKYNINMIRDNEVNAKVNQIISSIIKPNMTDVQKEIAIHDYIVENNIYDSETLDDSSKKIITNDEETNSAYAVLIKGKAMCKGYAEAIDKLLKAVGIEDTIVTGECSDEKGAWSGHAWNLVKLDGDYYQLDATWDDPVLKSGGQKLEYDYFNLTDTQISKDHKWDASKYPVANGTKYSQANLSLIEKDELGNSITTINSKDSFYNLLSVALRNRQNKLCVKILNYTNDYDDVIQRAINDTNTSNCDMSYYDNGFGARYITMNFTF